MGSTDTTRYGTLLQFAFCNVAAYAVGAIAAALHAK